MARKDPTQPRKAPRQERSKATVEALMRAAARVLLKHGYEGATTNRIAEVAGVSIGSLYQYFPSKEALVAALLDAHRERSMAAFFSRAQEVAEAPLKVAVRALVEAEVEVHSIEPELHRLLTEQVPRVGRLGALMEDLDGHIARVVRLWLEAHRAELRVDDLEIATFVVVHAVEAVVHRGVVDRSGARNTALTEATIDLVLRYLGKEEQPASEGPQTGPTT